MKKSRHTIQKKSLKSSRRRSLTDSMISSSLLFRAAMWLPSICLMLFIFFMSSRQNISVTHTFTSDFIIFKSLHVLEYALLTFLNFVALQKSSKLTYTEAIIYAIVFAFAYGVFDEIHQTFVPSRSGVPRDTFIDLFGMSLVGLLLHKNRAFFIKALRSYS